METSKKLHKSSNASDSQFGWQFQVNAGIFLMLKYIKEVKVLKIEGVQEDIELTKCNGDIIFAQAKSFVDPEDAGVGEKLKKGIRTLGNAIKNKKSCSTLIYITNAKTPICKKGRSVMIDSITMFQYMDLYKEEKKTVDKYIDNQGFPAEHNDKLYFCVLPYDGNAPELRHRELLRCIRSFTSNMNYLHVKEREILEKLQCLCNFDATDRSLSLPKENFVWAFVLVAFENITHNDEIWEKQDCDQATIDQIEIAYRSYIAMMTGKFSFLTKVITGFVNLYDTKFKKNDQEQYINSYWRQHALDAGINDLKIDENEREILMKLIMNKIFHNRRILDRIKKETNIV